MHVFILLGLKLNNDGELKEEAIGRLQKTLEAYKNQKKSYIIVCGGNSKKNVTEAKAMKSWLLKNNIPHWKIIEENSSKDTVENAIYSMKIVEKKKFTSITLITSDTHMKRAYILFKEIDYHNKLYSTVTFHTKNNNYDYDKERHLIEKDLKKLRINNKKL